MTAHDELVCDFAEYYRIYDLKTLPPSKAAVLACGLPESSRAKMKTSGEKFTFEQNMLVNIYDLLNWLRWSKTKDGAKNHNCPVPFRERLAEQEQIKEQRLQGFDSPEELMRYFERMRR